MAKPNTSLSGVVKEIDQVTKALAALKVGATPPERKLLDAKIKKLGALEKQTRALCASAKSQPPPTLNANPLWHRPKKLKK